MNTILALLQATHSNYYVSIEIHGLVLDNLEIIRQHVGKNWAVLVLFMIVSGIFPPMKMAPWTIAPRMIVPQIIASKEKCRLDNCPPGLFPSAYCSWTNTPQIIAPWTTPNENCLYNHQVILIHILPGKTKNELKFNLN